MKRNLSLLLLLALWATAQAAIKLPEIIGNDMVLQQRTQARLWGKADAHATVSADADWLGQPVTSDSRRVLKVKNYIDAHYMEPLRLTQLCDMAGMTPSAVSRFFKLRTGKTLNEYIIDVRLGYATRMLVDTTSTIAEISYSCGFNTLSNFNRQFKKGKGCSPSEFRKKYRKTKIII